MSFSSAKVVCPHDPASTTLLFPYNFHSSLPLFRSWLEKWYSIKIARKFLASVICSGHTFTSTEKVSTPTGCADEKKTPLQEPDFKKRKSLPPHGNPIKKHQASWLSSHFTHICLHDYLERQPLKSRWFKAVLGTGTWGMRDKFKFYQ